MENRNDQGKMYKPFDDAIDTHHTTPHHIIDGNIRSAQSAKQVGNGTLIPSMEMGIHSLAIVTRERPREGGTVQRNATQRINIQQSEMNNSTSEVFAAQYNTILYNTILATIQ